MSREIDLELRARIEGMTGRRVTAAHFVDRGYTPAERWVVTFEDGLTAFAKSGIDSETSMPATWLRTEHYAYSEIEGEFMPEMLGSDDDGVRPVLLLEDLRGANSWTREAIEAVSRTLEAVAGTVPPDDAPDLEESQRPHLLGASPLTRRASWRSVWRAERGS